MAMIVDEAQRNLSAFSDSEKAVIERLGKEYFYDVKKIQLLNKLNAADDSSLERNGEFTSDEVKKIKDLADRFSFDGYVRFRNDHYIKESKQTREKTGTPRANMVHLQVALHHHESNQRQKICWANIADARKTFSGTHEQS